MSLRVESTLITRPSQSPEEVALEAIAGDPLLAVTLSQYVQVGAQASWRPQVQPIASFTGPHENLAAMLTRLVPVDFAVVREQSTAGVLAMTEGMNAVTGTNIAYSRMWSNNNVSPSRTGVLFKPNGPLATAKPDYALLLGRLNKP